MHGFIQNSEDKKTHNKANYLESDFGKYQKEVVF